MNRLQSPIILTPPLHPTPGNERFARLGIWVPSRREQWEHGRECECEHQRKRGLQTEDEEDEDGQIDD